MGLSDAVTKHMYAPAPQLQGKTSPILTRKSFAEKIKTISVLEMKPVVGYQDLHNEMIDIYYPHFIAPFLF